MPLATIFSRALCLLGFLAVFSIQAPQSSAQAIPPDVLRELQRQGGSVPGPEQRLSPLDEARSQAQETEGQRALIQEEAEPAEASLIEMDYRERLQAPDLAQFGYDRLQPRRTMGSGNTVGRVSGSYRLGVGDEFAVVMRGAQEQNYIVPVDSEGRLILDGLPPIAAAGRSLDDVVSDVKNKVAQVYVGTEVYLSLASFAQITVAVVGEAEAPGTFLFTSQETVLDALVRAGGVLKTGSLRRIQLVRDGRARTVDLYSLFRGQSSVDLNIRDGDRIVIPPVGATYAVTGQVLRPGIFELPQGVSELSASTALNVAGGALRPRGYELIVSRLDNQGTNVVEPIKSSGRLSSGDALVVVRTGARTAGRLLVAGHVAAPGMRALATAPTVGDLLARSGGYLDEPYMPFAAILREDAKSLARFFVSVNLSSDDSDGLGMGLKDEDKLIVLGRKDIDFLSSAAVRDVVLQRRYESNVVCAPLSDLASLGQDLQTERFAAVLRSAFVLEGGGTLKVADVGSLTADQTENLGLVADGEGDAALDDLCPSVFVDNPGLLPFTLEHASTIAGSVRKPSVMPISGSVALRDLVRFSGGLSFEASLGNVEISSNRISENGMELDRSLFDLTKTPLESIIINRGAAITIQAVRNEQEPGTILLSGEFQRPGVYTVRRGEKLSSVIERAGGLTGRAYPYGGVFTRVSVRRAQQQAFRRTAREMNTALTTAALKNNVDAEALAAARELSQTMQSVETLGRVVVEADPRVLEVRKDLDVVMEPGDRLFIPRRPNHILAIGDVLNPGALQFVRGKTVGQYLAETGGIQRSADERRIFLVYPNGVARPLPRRFWGSSREKVPPGSTIVVPKDTDPLATLQLTREITSIVSQLAISAASFAVILNNN